MRYNTLNFNQTINEIRKCNPNVDIIVGDVIYDEKAMKRIFSSVDIKDLHLPEGLYINSNNCICGKNNFLDNMEIEVEDTCNIGNYLNVCPRVDSELLDINTTDVHELAIAIQKLNPRITVRLASKLYYTDAEFTIFTNIPIEQLALPSRYYVTNGNRITNKFNSDSCTYVSIKIEDIKNADPFYLIKTDYDIDNDKKSSFKVKELKKL